MGDGLIMGSGGIQTLLPDTCRPVVVAPQQADANVVSSLSRRQLEIRTSPPLALKHSHASPDQALSA
jgi:hypothetical protein